MTNFIHLSTQSINLALVSEIAWNIKDYSGKKWTTRCYYLQTSVTYSGGDGGEPAYFNINNLADRRKLADHLGYKGEIKEKTDEQI